MIRLVELKYKEAIDIVERQKRVYWKSGVFNPYILRTDIDKVIEDIKNSGFGVDVDEKDGDIYVCRPSNGDMF